MDNSNLHILREVGIICETQQHQYLPTKYNSILIGQSWYQLTLLHSNYYQVIKSPIKSTSAGGSQGLRRNQYLLVTDGRLDWVSKPDDIESEKIFEPLSLFTIISDQICCSLFPLKYSGYVICTGEQEELCIKKIATCLQGNYQTIFQYKITIPTQHHRPTPAPTPNNNQLPESRVKLSDLEINDVSKFTWITVVTNQPLSLPNHLQPRVYTKRLPSSLLYLDYIVQNYHKLGKVVFFLNKLPLYQRYEGTTQEVTLEYYMSNTGRTTGKLVRATVDTKINIPETRIRYTQVPRASNEVMWSSWYDVNTTTHSISQATFWSHILQLPLTNNIITYPSNNTYYVPSNLIKKHPLSWYQRLQKRLTQTSNYSMLHLDRMWYNLLA